MKPYKIVLSVIGGVIGLYGIAAFFIPIVPLSSNLYYELFSEKQYVATWTQVYTNIHTFSENRKDVTIRTPFSGATPFNSRRRNGDLLITPDAVYSSQTKVEQADPASTIVVNTTPFPVSTLNRKLGHMWEVTLYFYDDNNVYPGMKPSLVLPRNGEDPAIVYAQYRQDILNRQANSIQ